MTRILVNVIICLLRHEPQRSHGNGQPAGNFFPVYKMSNIPPSLQLVFNIAESMDMESARQSYLREGMGEADAAKLAKLRMWHGRIDGGKFPIAKKIIWRREEEIRAQYIKVVEEGSSETSRNVPLS